MTSAVLGTFQRVYIARVVAVVGSRLELGCLLLSSPVHRSYPAGEDGQEAA